TSRTTVTVTASPPHCGTSSSGRAPRSSSSTEHCSGLQCYGTVFEKTGGRVLSGSNTRSFQMADDPSVLDKARSLIEGRLKELEDEKRRLEKALSNLKGE